jgi:hypothetical protein
MPSERVGARVLENRTEVKGVSRPSSDIFQDYLLEKGESQEASWVTYHNLEATTKLGVPHHSPSFPSPPRLYSEAAQRKEKASAGQRVAAAWQATVQKKYSRSSTSKALPRCDWQRERVLRKFFMHSFLEKWGEGSPTRIPYRLEGPKPSASRFTHPALQLAAQRRVWTRVRSHKLYTL